VSQNYLGLSLLEEYDDLIERLARIGLQLGKYSAVDRIQFPFHPAPFPDPVRNDFPSVPEKPGSRQNKFPFPVKAVYTP